ncbi:MAG: tetratricopeptide repeat protein [Lishizhenia sp.]
MSRLYLNLLLLLSLNVFSQSELGKYLDFAKEKYEKGDYVYAIEYYQKAMNIDSNSVHTLWNYAETLKAYKAYSKAAYYYGEVYKREGTELYPFSLLNYGLMQKQNGKYNEALETFKQAKKQYRKRKREYVYIKSKQELKSCIWAINNQINNEDWIFEQLPANVNSNDAEFGHTILNNKLLFSSLRADSVSSKEEVYATTYKTRLYQTEIKDSAFQTAELITDLFEKDFSAGNGSFSLDKSRFYYSLCKDESYMYQCKIMVANYEGGKFKNTDTLGEIINTTGANTTMPFIGEWDGQEVLFFSSNRTDGKGGMDIWYSFISDGNQYKKPRNLRSVNSIDNELSPFWDNKETTLYYSSNWNEGYGGYDIFKSKYTTQFSEPENLGLPINSSANDLYFFASNTGDSLFFTSNRLGVNYSKNPTCCSDIFMLRKAMITVPETPEESLKELNKRLPVTLYFHNDIPNPRSWDTTSNINYLDSYSEYIALVPKYKKEYSAGLKGEKAEDAQDDIEDFFTEYVEQGVKDLELFRELLLKELEKGTKIELTIKGFASPLAKTDYNVNLTKRRIASLKNYLYSCNNGAFQKYFDHTAENGAFVKIVEIPFGEYTANQLTSDNPNDTKNSVYSRAAAIERKIELQSVNLIEE